MVHTPSQRKDPVCGMDVGTGSPHRLSRGGTEYLFCSPHCLETFRKDPGRYLEGREIHGERSGETPSEPEGKARAGGYTCPMHPEVRQEGPGSCPKCGMAL